jgi:hypothetical protein
MNMPLTRLDWGSFSSSTLSPLCTEDIHYYDYPWLEHRSHNPLAVSLGDRLGCRFSTGHHCTDPRAGANQLVVCLSSG